MKKNTLKIIGVVAAMILTIGMFAGCSSKKDSAKGSDELKTIKLNEVTRSIFYAPMYAAISQGFFEEEGIKIDLTTGQGADKTMQQLISGNVDIGFSGPEQVIYIYNQGRDDLPKVFAQLTQKDGSFLVAKDKHSNFSWDDIKGKKVIGGRPGGVPEMALEYVLNEKGIDKNTDIELITNISFDAVPAAFLGGTGDYAALFEPSATAIANEVNGQIVASVGEGAGNLPYTCFYALDSYIKDNKDLLVKFVRAIQKGQDWVMKSDDATVAKSIKSFFEGTEESTIATVVGNYKKIEAYAKTPVVNEEDMNRLMDIIQAYDKELITKRPPFADIVDTTISTEAIK
ncbi:MAG: ABC transporter substrate-binding protein [Clostridium sp.]|uniref:ABC transporter substrate-binding protein n=1 Tax=Clostridium culturomicium TaxID=1499683 RepID=UPI00058D84AF|nr:ABC transporter substrate-binding protein [Clostridium culturomicium]MDU4891097.1 ABC transporter substrate-binding protein [Clostridium sp.]MDU7085520.1 ABC transporter substrate-binding protein [Clostridium sp.]